MDVVKLLYGQQSPGQPPGARPRFRPRNPQAMARRLTLRRCVVSGLQAGAARWGTTALIAIGLLATGCVGGPKWASKPATSGASIEQAITEDSQAEPASAIPDQPADGLTADVATASFSTAAAQAVIHPKDGDENDSSLKPFLVGKTENEPLAKLSSAERIDSVDPVTYSLAELETLALTNNPTLGSARALADKASGLRYQVGRRPNPLLGYFGQQVANRNTDQHGFFVEQEFVRGDKLALNQNVLQQTQRAQQAGVDTQRYRVLTDVRVRFFEAMAAQQRLDAIGEFAEVARRGVDVAMQRREAGEGTLVDTLQSQTLLSEMTLAAEQAEVALAGAWNDLAAVAGLPPTPIGRLIADMDVPPMENDWEWVLTEIISQSPELAVARALVCEKSALYRRQTAQPIPNVTAQLGAAYDDATEHGMLNIQLAAPLPVWNRNKGNISAAYAEYVHATRELGRIEQSIRSRLARTAKEFDTALRAVQKYENEIIPQTSQSLELSEQAYRAGELDFLQVLTVRRSFFESTVRLIDARGQLAQAASKVDGLLLSGGLESPPDFTDGDGIRGASLGGQ